MHIGTDIIQIDRIKEVYSRFPQKFPQKFLHDSEIGLVKKIESLAGFWAAKEAISKALGCGIGKDLLFHDIIIKKDKKGRPYFVLAPSAQSFHPIAHSSLSISHDGGFAIAVVAVELKD